MNVQIDWGALGEVSLVSFATAVGVITLFAFGVAALAPPTIDPTSTPGETGGGVSLRSAVARPQAVLCFLACTLVVVYSLYLIIAK